MQGNGKGQKVSYSTSSAPIPHTDNRQTASNLVEKEGQDGGARTHALHTRKKNLSFCLAIGQTFDAVVVVSSRLPSCGLLALPNTAGVAGGTAGTVTLPLDFHRLSQRASFSTTTEPHCAIAAIPRRRHDQQISE